MPPDMPAAKLRPGLADDDDDPAGHVFAAVVARPLDDGDRAGIAHAETFARHAAEVAFAGDRAVEDGVADDDRGLRRQLPGLLRRVDDDASARQALADIVVGLALELEGHALGEEGAEALARRALELDVDRLVAQAGMPVSRRDDARQHRSGRTIRIADRKVEADVPAALDRVPASRRSGGGRAHFRARGPAPMLWWIVSSGHGVGLKNSFEKSRPCALACSISCSRSSICRWPIISSNLR